MIDAIVLSTSPLAPDVRVRRTVGVLAAAGLKVVTLTTAAERANAGDTSVTGCVTGSVTESGSGGLVRHITVPLQPWPMHRKAWTATVFLAARTLPGEAAALAMARAMPGIGAVVDRLRVLLDELSPSRRPPLVLANDWTTLPAAILAHDRYGCRIHYDTHEFAVVEHESNRLWRLAFPHLIARIERAGIKRATSISCVSPGIAREMARLYGLAEPPIVVRNLPDCVPLPPKPVADRIDVLYHGLFKPDRGLIGLIESVRLWPERYRLVLRGRAPNAVFGAALNKAAQAPHVAGRVVLEPMVAADRVVEAAQGADIGVFLPDLASRQNRLALPNKLFEYLGAGLMTIVPAGTDMADVVVEHGTGLALDTGSPEELAAALTRLTPERIASYKAAANRAAKALTFATEAETLRRALGLG